MHRGNNADFTAHVKSSLEMFARNSKTEMMESSQVLILKLIRCTSKPVPVRPQAQGIRHYYSDRVVTAFGTVLPRTTMCKMSVNASNRTKKNDAAIEYNQCLF